MSARQIGDKKINCFDEKNKSLFICSLFYASSSKKAPNIIIDTATKKVNKTRLK
jgi:hypothetical protein